jgi:alkanesulfonate monooxygenase SsuD/methylene tetrahydromethanopterin reductase-like flavin-dependent oxidoreductase (luciferase family)
VTQTGPISQRLKIGLFLPLIEDTTRNGVTRWTDLLAMAQTAEAIGLDSLWVPDHFIFHGRHPGEGVVGQWEAWSVIAALAAATSRVEIGPLVLATTFRNPALLAKMADTVDEISNGRLILGVGAGWNKPEYDAFGYPFDHRYSRFEESLTIIHGLLHDGAIDFEGTYYQARDCELRPRGPRKNGPPILIGTSGEKMLRLTARYAEMWNVDWRNSADLIPPFLEKVDQACADVGRDPATLIRTCAVEVDLTGNPALPVIGSPPIRGSAEEIAAQFRAFADIGVSHLILQLDPPTVAGVEMLAPVLERL